MPIRVTPQHAMIRRSNDRPVVYWAGWLTAGAALLAFAGSIGGGPDPLTALSLITEAHLLAGWPAIILLFSMVGFGRWAARFCPASGRAAFRHAGSAVGAAIVLGVILLLGTAGLLSGYSVWVLCAAGLAGLIIDPRGRRAVTSPFRHRPPGWLWIGLPGIAILLAAAASPPGGLWNSEYAGYDALSYHLQLPKEWIAAGHTRPVEHNAYSYLPGAIEQAYACLGWLGGAGSQADGLLARDGAGLSAAHTFHAGLTILAAMMLARLSARLALAAGATRTGIGIASAIGGGFVLCTPWTVVVGSMAYNEMGVVLLGAGAMLVASRRKSEQSITQAVLVGGLVASACLCKPTALLFVGVPAGIVLLRFARLKQWPAVIIAGSIAGLVVLSPWLIRNTAMTGNPVFPLATGVLGEGYWSTAQAARFAAAHRFEGGLLERAALLVLADPTVSEGANAVARYRGTSNTQWLLAFPAGVLALTALLLRRRTRNIAVGLGMCLGAQLIAWLVFTHIQSRFLVPCLIVLGPAIGVGLGVWARRVVSTRMLLGTGIALCALQASALWAIFSEQLGGHPNALLGAPPSFFMGKPYTPEVGRFSPIAYLNHEAPPDSVTVLVGDATPLYYRNPVLYATVWDTPPFLLVDDGETRLDFVLINDAELARQRDSGYLNEGLTPDRLAEMTAGWRLVRAWPEIGARLYRVRSGVDPESREPQP